VDTLEEIPRDQSIDEARKILRWLRNMEFTELAMEEFIDQGTPETVTAKKHAVQQLTTLFASQLKHARHARPDSVNHPDIHNACDAILAITLALLCHTRSQLKDDDARRERLEQLIDNLPARADLRQAQSVSRLLDLLEAGLQRTSGRDVELSLGEQMLATFNRLQATAKKTDESPREESLELARESLRTLKTMAEGKLEQRDDKIAFIKQADEMVELYRNLLTEAAQRNPEILNDPRIKNADSAVGNLTHRVSLMAAKEIPNSIASAQQISADVTEQPEEWKNLHDRTISRLIQSAEEGLEKVMGDIEQNEQDEERAAEQQQEAAETAALQSDHSKRHSKKKRGGGSTQRSGKGGKKQKKQMLDLTADDYVLKQGRFTIDAKAARSDNKPAPAAIKGVKIEDMETIRKLGNSLRDIGNQLQGVTTPAANPVEKSSGNKGRAQRQAERERQAMQQQQAQPQKPKNPPKQPQNPRGQGPRV
jgi:hypothetical protein